MTATSELPALPDRPSAKTSPRRHADDAARRKRHDTPRLHLECDAGQTLYVVGGSGAAWRVSRGSLRLDRQTPEGETAFANLAIAGDVIGAETLLFNAYSFTATALTPCLLTPWPEGENAAVPAGDVLKILIAAEARAAQVIALRYGQAAERVRRLILLLARAGGERSARAGAQVTLPPRQDMADITALTLETVSRMVSGLRRNGMLNPVSSKRFSLSRLTPHSALPKRKTA